MRPTLLALLVSAGLGSPIPVSVCIQPAHAAIPPEFQNRFDQAKDLVKKVTTNLALAQESAGPGVATDKITGSRARLVLTRLNQAVVNVDPAKSVLDALPQDDTDVKSLRAELTKAEEAIDILKQRLGAVPATPPPAATPPTGATPPVPAAPAAPAVPSQPAAPTPPTAPLTTKLDYRQVEQLKNATFHLNEVEGNINALKEANAKWGATPEADKDTIDYRDLLQAIATLENAQRKLGFARTALDPLPPTGADRDNTVAAQRARLDQAAADLPLLEAAIKPLNDRVQRIINPATYPALTDDLKRLAGLAQQFADTQVFQSSPLRASDLVAQMQPAREEAARIAAAYAVLIAQRTTEGEQFAGSARHVDERLAAFASAAKAQTDSLPAALSADIDETSRLADDAVANKRTAWFAGGLAERSRAIADRVMLLQTLDAAKGNEAAAKLNALNASLREKEAALAEAIITGNSTPPDRFTGDAKDALIKQATDAWLLVQPGAEVLKAVIPSEGWSRETLWRYENRAWRFIDRSSLQVQLIVKVDDRLAAIRPINLWTDHTHNDARSAITFDADATSPPPARVMLIANVK